KIGVDLQIAGGGVDEVERATVSPHLFLRPVAWLGVFEDERDQPVWSDGHSFDAVGGLDALDEGRVPQSFEELWRLLGVEILPASGFRDVGQQPDRAEGKAQAGEPAAAEGHHDSPGTSRGTAGVRTLLPGTIWSESTASPVCARENRRDSC